MRVATWNINGLRARIDFVLHWLEARRPDVVGLQELKVEDDQFPHLAFEAAGYHAVVHGQKAWNGVAILSRSKPEVLQRGLPGQDALGARLVSALVDGVDFTTVYCPNGKGVDHDDYPRKLEWFEALRDHLASRELASRAAVVAGDFNVCPTFRDTWDEARHEGAIFHTEDERERFRAIEALGLRDAYRAMEPEGRKFSWWDYRGGAFHRNLGLRIDLLLASDDVLGRATAVEIDREYRKKKDGLTASDHAPVILDLD